MLTRARNIFIGCHFCVLPFAFCLLIFLAPAQAITLNDIQGRAQQVAAERGRSRLDMAGEQAVIARLGELVLAFIDQCDQAARAGNERREGFRPVFEAIYGPLNGIYTARSGFIDRKAKEIMDADGDLEALYETREWRESQSVAAQALYYLDWLNFYGARLFDGTRRTELLEAAQRGFSEFAGGEAKKELSTESTLGRGLCHLELGNYDWAIRDFRTILEEPTVSPERKEKARLAVLDAYGRGGKLKESLQYSQDLLNSGSLDPADAPVVRFYRLHTLFDAMKTTPANADAYRREATALMDQLRKAGKGWSEKVDALMVSRVEDPAKWVGKVDTPAAKWELAALLLQKGDEASAMPLLKDVVASEDPTAKSHRAEANYYLGVARFKAADHAAALGHFDAALSDARPEFAADAAYMRFKTLEALMAKGTNEELGKRYVDALKDFLKQHPNHASAFEARYRLAEYLQAQSEFEAAMSEYAKVSGDAGFEFRARFGALQSEFELLKEANTTAARDEVAARIGKDLESFWQQAKIFAQKKDRGDVPIADFEAKATVMQAVYDSLHEQAGSDGMVKLLAGFEQRYPNQKELFPQVLRLRLGALQRLSRFAEAEQEVTKRGATLREDGKTDALEKLATAFVKAGGRRKIAGDAAGGKAAEQVALRLYELLADDGAKGGKQKLTVARLYESNDDFEQADAAYKDVLKESAESLPALRGLARVAEARKNLPEALNYWKRFTVATRPGDPPWYEGRYQQARLTLERGDSKGCCAILDELKPAMPGLSDADLRRQLGELYKKACS